MSTQPSASHTAGRVSSSSMATGTSASGDSNEGAAQSYTLSAPQRPQRPPPSTGSPFYRPELLTPRQQAPLSITTIQNGNPDTRTWSTRIKRLMTELQLMTDEPLSNCSASPKGDDLTEWTATLQGPPGTVYEGGTFFLDIAFPKDYPYIPPKIRFATKIYHCNINSQGVICIDILQQNWSPALTVTKILLSISSLLCECNPEDPLVGSVATMYKSDKEEHDRTARMWTVKYAT